MIVWKTLPFKNGFDTSWDVNQYVSCYLLDINAKAFLVYSWEDYYAYGIILCNDEINYSESDLLYDILGLDSQEYELVYTDTGNDTKTDTANETAIGTSYSTYYPASSGSSHYHTVVPDRYTLSRTDPGAYYDHYEYGDNYEIDDYLESEGYD